MAEKTLGFVGGGRATRFILCGLKRAGTLPSTVVVSDLDAGALDRLRTDVPEVTTALGDNSKPAGQDIVFIAVHPPAVMEVLSEIRPHLKPTAVLVSIAPRLSIAKMAEGLDGFRRIARMIPNAPSLVNSGYNPVSYSDALSQADRIELGKLFSALGEYPEVAEEALEAYAVLTAMGPTCLWFQMQELQKIGESIGLAREEASRAVQRMVEGAVRSMYESGLPPEEVVDLVPVKPLEEHEGSIREAYRTKLSAVFARLKG
ncbi:MAG: pyrroline-5-carboxylate reductase family protein [Armatimonadota bacterium]